MFLDKCVQFLMATLPGISFYMFYAQKSLIKLQGYKLFKLNATAGNFMMLMHANIVGSCSLLHFIGITFLSLQSTSISYS